MGQSKYQHIQLEIVDTRNQTTSMEIQQKQATGTQLVPVKSAIPSLEEIFQYFLLWIRHWLLQLYAFGKSYDFGNLSRFKIPWLQIALLALALFILLKKDMQFNIALKAPAGALLAGEDEQSSQLVHQSLNPYAPVSPAMLADKETAAFIKKYADLARHEMSLSGVPASIKMAQALIESRAGNSKLAKLNNNHFGMKCFSQKCKKGHCSNFFDDHHKDFFRKYTDPKESWRSHSRLLSQGRYKHLAQYGKDYKKWAKGLKAAGYATDKRYDIKLINTIEKYQLYRLDQ